MTNSRRLVFPALITAGILWGTTVPLSKLALGWLPPAWLAFTRFALAAGILMIISRGRLRGAASPAILISGGLGFGLSVVLQNFGVQRTSVSHAALLIGATPVLVAILAAAFRQGVARPAAWAGFGLSLAGVAVIASGKGGGASLGGDGLVLLAQLGSAGFTVSQPKLLRGRDPLAVTAVQLFAAAVVTLPLALVSGGLHASHASPAALLATAGLIVAGTVGPTALFAFGQSHVSADVAGAFLNLEPLVGAIIGVVLFANPVGLPQLAGGAAILAGIGLSSVQAAAAERRSRASAYAQPVPALAAVPADSPRAGIGLAAGGAAVRRVASGPGTSALRASRSRAHRRVVPAARRGPRPAPAALRLVRRGHRAARRPSRAARRPSRAARPPSRAARPPSRAGGVRAGGAELRSGGARARSSSRV
jgi:O-acetylserine/cysteine efflux transporter